MALRSLSSFINSYFLFFDYICSPMKLKLFLLAVCRLAFAFSQNRQETKRNIPWRVSQFYGSCVMHQYGYSPFNHQFNPGGFTWM